MPSNDMADVGGHLKDEERTPCEIWSRAMGYHRPITAYNPGKQQEWADRRMFEEHKVGEG